MGLGQLPAGFQAEARRWRSAAVLLCTVALVALTYLSLGTVRGQNLDNLAMESLMSSSVAAPLHLEYLRALVSVPALAVLSVVVGLLALLRRRPALAWRALLVVVGANVSAQVLKELISRPYLGVSFDLQNSYPSGHVAYAAAIAVALIIVAPRGWRSPLTFVGWVWTTLMGVMVISGGWHRLSDVLASLLVVAIWGFLAAPAEIRPRVLPGLTRAATAVSGGLLFCGAAVFGFAVSRLWAVSGAALSRKEILDLVTPGTVAGNSMALATFLLVAGLTAVFLNGVDRLSEAN